MLSNKVSKPSSRFLALLAAIAPLVCTLAHAQSVFTQRPEDPHAVYLNQEEFHAHGDGLDDDSDALQQAIDRVQETTRRGVVFIPQGRYRLDKTIHVWSGIRLIGYGAKRPVFILPKKSSDATTTSSTASTANPPSTANTAAPPLPAVPANQAIPTLSPPIPTAIGNYMLWFTDERTIAGTTISDASEFTFWSGLDNIDFEIGEGNPNAVAIRFNVAQHGFITHANFQLGSARAAIEAVGNQASDIHISGGQFGILTGKTSPAWQFLLMDSSFDGQQDAAISTHDAGFTLVRDRFENMPVAIEIPKGEVEQLYGRNLQMNHIGEAVLQVGDIQNLRSEITLENIACDDVAKFAEGLGNIAGKDPKFSSEKSFVETRFRLGLEIAANGSELPITLHHTEEPLPKSPAAHTTDIPSLPSMKTWANVHELGVQGDGITDDTAAIQKALDEHKTLYFPFGMYRLTGSLHLRPDSVLIGFSPIATQFVLNDAEPNFAESASVPADTSASVTPPPIPLPIPLLVAPQNGTDIVTGIGIATGNDNPRAAGIEWQAGAHSMLEDIDFIRGHSGFVHELAPSPNRPASAMASPRNAMKPLAMKLEAQYPSLWIHNGGGGILRGIWSHAGTARAGLLIENTTTPGVIYQFSCEHHMHVEVHFDHAANWRVYDLQTEEENPEGAEAIAMAIDSSHNLVFDNTYMYRVSRNVMPMPYAVIAHDSHDISFDNVKVFSQTRLAFDNAIFAQNTPAKTDKPYPAITVRAHDFTYFNLGRTSIAGSQATTPTPTVFAADAKLTRAATGFSNASGLTTDDEGNLYFTDAVAHSIYRYTEAAHQADMLAKVQGSPMVLGFVAPSKLLVVNNEKSVASIDTKTGVVAPVKETPIAEPSTELMLPTGLHNSLVTLDRLLDRRGYVYRVGSNTALRSELIPEHRGYYYAPQTTTAIMAGGTWRPLLQSSQLELFKPGERHYITSEDDARTYTAEIGNSQLDSTANSAEKLSVQLFVERGGTSVLTTSDGHVLIAGSQVYIYSHDGHLEGILEVPERPTSLAIGGANHKILYIGARSSIYSIELANTPK